MRRLPILLPLFPLLLCSWSSAAADRAARPEADAIARACAGCHGAQGQGFEAIPAINRIPEAEFVRRMKAFRDGQRSATVMDRIAKGYDDEDFAALAKYFNHH
jgi:sulfide dehydrogenase cytochrome subunit